VIVSIVSVLLGLAICGGGGCIDGCEGEGELLLLGVSWTRRPSKVG
jgi:hypothetical protein